MGNGAWIISCLSLAAVFFGCTALFAIKKEKGADYVAGFNSLSESQKARYDRAAISRHYLTFMRLLGEISLLCAALAHWIGLWAFAANLALLLACCAPETHNDWEKAFEEYKLNNQPKGF